MLLIYARVKPWTIRPRRGIIAITTIPATPVRYQMLKQITVLLPNVPGRLAAVADLLAKRNVDIIAYHLSNAGRTGFVQLICEPHDKAIETLIEKYKYYVIQSNVISVRVPNQPGGLQRVLSPLRERVNITNSYSYDKEGDSFIILDIEEEADRILAEQLLREAQIEVTVGPRQEARETTTEVA